MIYETGPNATWADCFKQCMQAAQNCSAFLYTDADCIMAAQSKTSKFVKYEVENEDEILTTKTCLAGLLNDLFRFKL